MYKYLENIYMKFLIALIRFKNQTLHQIQIIVYLFFTSRSFLGTNKPINSIAFPIRDNIKMAMKK
jgi:hypothetical protein